MRSANETEPVTAARPLDAQPNHSRGLHPDAMNHKLWIAMPLASIGIYAVWGGLLSMIFARQIALLEPDSGKAAALLGSLLGMGSLLALVAQPVMGGLSDRTPANRVGRRNIWIAIGATCTSLALAGMALNTGNIAALFLLSALAIIPLSSAHAALATVLPERVPRRHQGKMSGLNGAMTIIGYVTGVTICGFMAQLNHAYFSLAAILFVTCAIFVLLAEEPQSHVAIAEPTGSRWHLPDFRENRPFWFAFVSRCAFTLGYYMVIGVNLFILKDYIGFAPDDPNAAARELAKIIAFSMGLSFAGSIAVGVWSDRVKRTIPFVIFASISLTMVGALFMLSKSLWSFYVVQMLLGTVYSIYVAVDNVLMANVLPKTDNAGRDLGILNIANSGPQAAGPALAGLVLSVTGNYYFLFSLMAAFGLVAAAAAAAIRMPSK